MNLQIDETGQRSKGVGRKSSQLAQGRQVPAMCMVIEVSASNILNSKPDRIVVHHFTHVTHNQTRQYIAS